MTLLDTNELVAGVSRQGIWNFTTVTIPQGATVRIIGPYRAHFRCQGQCVLGGIIQAIPGQVSPPTLPTPVYDKGAQSGQQNNGMGIDCEANGGVGNAGARRRRRGLRRHSPVGSPPTFQCAVRALMGENGYGPTIDGLPNDGTTPNPLYAGGQGGDQRLLPRSRAGVHVREISAASAARAEPRRASGSRELLAWGLASRTPTSSSPSRSQHRFPSR